jgi:hypothetical protein
MLQAMATVSRQPQTREQHPPRSPRQPRKQPPRIHFGLQRDLHIGKKQNPVAQDMPEPIEPGRQRGGNRNAFALRLSWLSGHLTP